MVPTEILCHIFSFLSYPELYRIRSVCHEWKYQSEHTLYLLFKRKQQKLSIQIGERASVIDLIPVNYDPDNQVIEFRTPCSTCNDPDEYDIYISSNQSSTSSSPRAKVLFSEWHERTMVNSDIIQNLDLAEKAQVLFHLTYNPCLEQFYELPPMSSIMDSKTRYTGDRGIIIAFEYHNEHHIPSVATEFQGLNDEPVSPFDTINDHDHHQVTNRIKIKSIYTTLSWLLSGINPDVIVQQIYKKKYQTLVDILASHGLTLSSPYSEDVFRYLVEEEKEYTIEDDLSTFNKERRGDQHQLPRLIELQNKLEENGVDPRVVWKYTFAKNFIARPQYSNMRADDVAKTILESEKKWMIQKIDLLRKVSTGEEA